MKKFSCSKSVTISKSRLRTPILIGAALFIQLLLFSVQLFAQNITVKGRVLREDRQPVQRASVLIKGQTSGTISNDNGEFQISAPASGTLVVSAVDFTTQEIKINNRAEINITLVSNDKTLGEVVVVGYGTQRRKDITGAVASIKGETLREVPQPNVIGQLQGRLPGVDIVRNNSRPGTAGQIRIRGNRTIASGTPGNDDAFNAPLIVLDGIPYGGSINDLSPDDVLSIDILKDASATAIYGSRGSNGVILITTKRGRIGKPVITYNSYYGIANVTKQYNIFNGTEYAAFKQQAKDYNNGVSNYPLTTAEQAGLTNGTSTDWQDLIYKQAYVTNHELGVSGGSEGSQYSLGGGYYKETAVVPGQNFERFSLRTTIDSKIGQRFKIGVNSINSLSYSNGGGLNPINALLSLSPLLAPYNPDGTLNLYPAVGTSDPTKVNPLTINDENAIVNRARRLRTFNSLYGEVQILKELKYRVNVGLDYRQDQGDNYFGPNTLYNAGTSAPPAPGTTSASSMTVTNAEAWTYLIENLLTYERTFLAKHRVSFTGLYSVQKDHNQGSGFSAQGIPADYIQDYNLNLAFGNLTAQNGSFSESGLLSYMGRLNYSYDNRYSLTATLRRDGSSRLSPGHQWFTYPAIGVAWNISNEKFISNVAFVSNLKLRGGWGTTASQGIAPYLTLGTLATNFYNYGNQNATGYYVNFLANKNLKWQATSNWNIGLDFSLLKNRITGTIDVYSQKTKDILLNQSLPPSNGASATIINLGKSKGHGVEISLSSINLQTKSGLTWSTDFTFSSNREEIVELNSPTLKADIGNGWFVGQPFTVIYDVKKIGIWQTKDATLAATYGQKPGQIRVQDLNNDGKINADDRQIIGNFQPDWIGGMTNRVAYKNFDLSVVLFARMGQMVVVPYLTSDGGANGYDFFGNGRINSFRRNYWTTSNGTDEFPSPDAATDGMTYGSTLGYRDGSFIKCRSINLGYNLPAGILHKVGITSLRVYVTVQNPFIIYSPLVKTDLVLDPEGNGYSANGASQAVVSSTAGGTPVPQRAITVGLNTPPTRQFLFGINLKF